MYCFLKSWQFSSVVATMFAWWLLWSELCHHSMIPVLENILNISIVSSIITYVWLIVQLNSSPWCHAVIVNSFALMSSKFIRYLTVFLFLFFFSIFKFKHKWRMSLVLVHSVFQALSWAKQIWKPLSLYILNKISVPNWNDPD